MRLMLRTDSLADYRRFLRIKSLPRYSFCGHVADVPDEYAALLEQAPVRVTAGAYQPPAWMFDYQRDVTALAVRKRRFAVFMACRLGKTNILLEFARHALTQIGPERNALIVSPLMVVRQTMREAGKFFGAALPLEQVRAADLQGWLRERRGVCGITNYEAIADGLQPGRLGILILDESSVTKSAYGRWGTRLIRLGRGLEWKLCCTGTPAPNDRIEYANHAVYLDQYPTVNSFLARFFVNRGQTDNRWELKPHALRPFYTALAHWCIFVTNPATYGWRDNVGTIPPMHVHIHDVPLTDEQRELVSQAGGDMFGTPRGITSRAVLSQLAKGRYRGRRVATCKPRFIRNLVDTWPDEQTIIWCLYNHEQDFMEAVFPEAASMRGDTPQEERERLLEAFQVGKLRTLISKPKVLGFGLNLEMATRQVFSGLQDSYESYWQAVKRSNGIGSPLPLNVHIPVTPVERPMVETVLAKAARVQRDTDEQERIFKETGYAI